MVKWESRVEDMERLKILITGGTGFVGSNLVRCFYKGGHDIAMTMRTDSNMWRISDLSKNIRIFNTDLTDKNEIMSTFTSFKPDIIINTVAYGGYHFETDVSKIISANFNGTVNLVESFLKSSAELLINTGSSSEYGLKDSPMSEESLLEPIGAYAVSKAASTLYSRSRSIETGRKIITFRLFSVYGYFEEAHRLVPHVILSLLKKRNALMNNPNSVRDFIHIDDVFRAYEKLVREREQIMPGEIFNLGTGVESSVMKVVKILESVSGNKLNIEWQYGNERIGDKATRWVSDMSKMKSALNWTPKYSLEEGLSRTYDWFKDNISKYEVIENSKSERLGK